MFYYNQGKHCYKLGQLHYYKLGQILQIRSTLLQNRGVITNWAKIYDKLGQVLQIRTIITNWGITNETSLLEIFLIKTIMLST